MNRVKGLIIFLLAVGVAVASTPYELARQSYHRTDYSNAIKVLTSIEQKNGQAWLLTGQCWFMQAEYKKATEAFEHAVELDPQNAEYVHWLGKGWGRRAETANPLMAPGYASKARGFFERSVLLDPSKKESLNDLFDYYMEAPGFLGGGLNRAEALIEKISKVDEAEGHYARAQLLDKRKEFDAAEQHLRRALDLAPRQLGRFIDLAQYLSKRGRVAESEDTWAQADRLAPASPRILFEKAKTYVRDNRNQEQARALLQQYLRSSLTVDDPPREKAQELLRKVRGSRSAD